WITVTTTESEAAHQYRVVCHAFISKACQCGQQSTQQGTSRPPLASRPRGYSGYYQVGSAAHLALAQPCPFQFESDGRVQ
ncbi:hypothetical protein SERLADRAFT_462247, partial [Serpula lacrymans var. lacrymans S7.9]